jgi:hypothetical protein
LYRQHKPTDEHEIKTALTLNTFTLIEPGLATWSVYSAAKSAMWDKVLGENKQTLLVGVAGCSLIVAKQKQPPSIKAGAVLRT